MMPSGAPGGAGCDIYRARLDPRTWAPTEVLRLTDDPVPEVFPSVGAGGARVYFHTAASVTARAIGVVDVARSARTILLPGAQPPGHS